jgi:hypothetical protein
MNSSAHMISQTISKTGTAIEVPEERAFANSIKPRRFEPKPEVPPFAMSKTSPCRRQVKRIALRFASLSPHSARNPGVRAASARNSLSLSPEIKTHNA